MAWQPIETAPKDDFVYLYPSYMLASWDHGAEDWLLLVVPLEADRTIAGDWSVAPKLMFELCATTAMVEPTHWMPLPAPPKEMI